MRKIIIFIGGVLFLSSASAVEVNGFLDVRVISGDDTDSWLYHGLGKQRFDADHDGLRLGQAALQVRGQAADTLSLQATVNAYDDRNGVVDLVDAALNWRPLPSGAWRWNARAGAFFPLISFENTNVGWTSPYLLSSSAINNWLGEEVRTVGTEISLVRAGQLFDSPHDINISMAAFGWNDSAGALLALRGWTVGDRVTGLTEKLPLPHIPALAAGSDFEEQGIGLKPFHEIDDRYGYYTNFQYSYAGQLTWRVMHYDNRGDPTRELDGQYAWDTRFNAAGASWQISPQWIFMAQWLGGCAESGDEPDSLIRIKYRAEYALLSWTSGAHRISTRYDKFWVDDRDINAVNNSSEYGDAFALAYWYAWRYNIRFGVEALRQNSYHDARETLNIKEKSVEDSAQFSLRWSFK